MDLRLPVKREYFDQIKSGQKLEEYRAITPYWKKRIEGKTFDRVIITLGYPKSDDLDRMLFRAWRGYVTKTIIHKHFDFKPTKVYAIRVN